MSYIRQAIITKYIGPTNYRGSRVKATSGSGLYITIEWDDALSGEQNHKCAADALMTKMGWDKYSDLVQGGLDTGYAFVMVPKGGR